MPRTRTRPDAIDSASTVPNWASVVLPSRRPLRQPGGDLTSASSRRRRRGRRRAGRLKGARARPWVRTQGFRLRFWAGLASALCWALLGVLWWHPAFRVEKVQVKGLVRVDGDKLAAWSAFQDLVGRPAVAIRPDQLKRTLQEAFPVFRDVQIRVVFPNRVVLEVVEREPILVWKEGNETFWVDAEGVKFYAWGTPDPSWPKVTVYGRWYSGRLKAEDVTLILELTERTQVKNLIFHPQYGFGWQTSDGWRVYIGRSLDDWEARLRLYEEVRRALEARGQTTGVVRLISTHAVVVLPKEEGQLP